MNCGGELIKECAATIVDDEYDALVMLKREQEQALFSVIDRALSDKEQMKAFTKASRIAASQNPAYDDIWGSRSSVVTQQNIDRVYEILIKRGRGV